MDHFTRFLEDGRELTIYPLTFGRARISVGPSGGCFIDNSW